MQFKELGLSPTSGPYFPPPAEMKRQHALSLGQIDYPGRDRTQTVESYTGDLTELPIYTGSEHYSKNRMTMLSRIRTTSESEGVSSRKPDNVSVVFPLEPIAFLLSKAKITEHALKGFYYSALEAWNNIPANIRESQTLWRLKGTKSAPEKLRMLKTHTKHDPLEEQAENIFVFDRYYLLKFCLSF